MPPHTTSARPGDAVSAAARPPGGKRLHNEPPFRAEHIGSLLRPRALKEAWKRFEAGDLAEPEFRAAVDAAVREAVRLQEDAGFRAVTDGEFRRRSYWSHVVDAVPGFAVRPARYRFRDAEGREQAFLAPFVEAPVRHARPIAGEAFDFLRKATRVTAKVTMPSPATLHFWRGAATLAPGVYGDEEAYFADLAEVYRREIADLAARGARYLQLDEVPLAMLCDAGVREAVAAEGGDPARLAGRYVQLINDCLAGAPAGLTVGLHLCRGNFKGRWLSEGGYDDVAELLFNEARVDVFFLEFDGERAGGFAPLAQLPPDKVAVLGLIGTKTPGLEAPDEVKRRIGEAARHAPLANLGLSPQCGFASTVGGNPLGPDDQRRKLDLVVAVAETVWGSA